MRTLLLLLLWAASALAKHVPRSCREHYLSGHTESSILPIKSHRSSEVNVECRMPYSGSLPASVTTVVRSALERGVRIADASTVQWQISDVELLTELLTKTHCRQSIHVNRTIDPEDKSIPSSGGVMLISVLGEQTYLAPDQGTGSLELSGRFAGILHVVPDVIDADRNPFLQASELLCEEPLLKHEECLIDGGLVVDVSASTHTHFRFSFRTDLSDQLLFATQTVTTKEKVHVDLRDDYFLVSGSADAVPTMSGHLSDGRWHTVHVAVDGTHYSIDRGPKIELPGKGRIATVNVKLNGLVMLTDPVEESNGCSEGTGRLFLDREPSHTRPFCTGAAACECTVLGQVFTHLPSPTCAHDELDDQNGFQLLRHPDLLSFMMLPDSLSSTLPLRLSLAFKSDSDSGLLLFGEWRNATWGRVQVHYHGQKLTAMRCTQEDENAVEKCSGCAIGRTAGYGTDTWTRVTVFQRDGEEAAYLTVDGEICHLNGGAGFDTAEMYKTVLTRGSVLFIGGMFNKKVRPGIYRDDFKAKFFENTREKLPSLRGCVKDVFCSGQRVDLLSAFDRQMHTTLVSPSTEKYAIKMGCGHCPLPCPLSSRCRPSSPSSDPSFACDCADVEMHPRNDGTCEREKVPPLSLAASSFSAYRGEFAIAKQKGILAKLWMKIRFPSVSVDKDTPLAIFFSHGRRLLFRFFLTPRSTFAVQVNPEDPQQFAANAEHTISPSDDRVHLVTIERRTPLGTHPSRRFFDLYVDGTRYELPDPGMQLTAIEFALLDMPTEQAGCIQDLGLGYDYDELRWADDSTENGIRTVNVLRAMVAEMGLERARAESTCGVLDPLFWSKSALKTAPLGVMIEYSPNLYLGHTGGPLSSEWLLYSIILTVILALFLISCLCIYFICLRRRKSRRRNSDDDRERIMRESPDYPVILRRPTSDRDSFISDSDRTDFSAYDDVKVHKVKVDRESMISFLEPTTEKPSTAHVVSRGMSPPDAPLVRIGATDL